MTGAPDFANWICPLPLRDYPNIVMGHGGGGKLSAELVEHVFLPHFGNPVLAGLGDSSVVSPPPGRLAVSTDSFVVRPLFFPGGSIGELAVNGTVNDLAMSGARPLYLSAGFILEEGFPLVQLVAIVERMAAAARAAGVEIVTGDTKVVERGHGDGCYINTSGIGVLPDGLSIAPALAQPGDVVLTSGSIGDHGMAVMSVREGLEFETRIESDCAPLYTLVQVVLDAIPPGALHVLRDPTRGGVASSLNEIATSAGVGIEIEESRIPVNPEVQAACEILGLDPIYVANEGKLLAIVAPEAAEAALAAMQSHALGKRSAIIGKVTADRKGMLIAKTRIGGTRVVPMQIGEQLPRIC
ncbi:MAG: hydrogenase expression/formation protein HypE [Bryobacterales bacterium]|nr:hydrogenase expression/formation protein HypE [Bryobacterales bacterium]